jgi:hypothetical protein
VHSIETTSTGYPPREQLQGIHVHQGGDGALVHNDSQHHGCKLPRLRPTRIHHCRKGSATPPAHTLVCIAVQNTSPVLAHPPSSTPTDVRTVGKWEWESLRLSSRQEPPSIIGDRPANEPTFPQQQLQWGSLNCHARSAHEPSVHPLIHPQEPQTAG